MEPAKQLQDQFEEELEKTLNEDNKIVDITKINGSTNEELEEDDEIDYYELLQGLLKKATMIIRTYGAVYFISFMLSAWVANRMFDFAIWDQASNNWLHPLNELCIVFTSAIIGYVCISLFWKYLFVNIANIDDAVTIKKLYKLWWLRAIYPVILGIFTFFTWRDVLDFEGGRNFAVFVSMVFGAQLIFSVVCEVFLQKVYKELKKF